MVAELLYDLLLGPSCRARLVGAFAPLCGEVRCWVALLAALHDLGKLSPAFQALRADVAGRFLSGWARDDVIRLADRRTIGRTDTQHGVLTALHLMRLLSSWGAPMETIQVLAQVLGGHHGTYFSHTALGNARAAKYDHGGEQWSDKVDHFVRRLAGLLGLPNPQSLPWSRVGLDTTAAAALAGLTTVSDWIASSLIREEEYAGVGVDLEDYVGQSRRRAEEYVIDKLGWSAWVPPADTSFRRLFNMDPYPLQRGIADLIETRTKPGIFVIDAPTGDGKTYSALHGAVSLIRQLQLTGFYLAMPTRATSNQAFEEANTMLNRFDPTVAVRLLHGTAAQYMTDRRAQALADMIAPRDVGIDEKHGSQDAEAQRFFTRLRELLTPFAIGTVDRLLMGGIRSRWAPVPLVGVSSRVLILDEVHGYELHMSTLLDRLLWWLGWLEVPVILLSATLPTVRRDELIRHWYAGTRRRHPSEVDLSLPKGAYPQALWVDQSGVPEVAQADTTHLNRTRVVSLSRISDDELKGWALERASRGWGVAIVHNIVRRAAVSYTRLTQAVASLPDDRRPRIVTLTARLTHAQRNSVEAELRRLFGRNGERAPTNGFIVVGTQILEESLDLDFDAMASDPAPVDSIVQRCGRLHRFRLCERTFPAELALVGAAETKRGPRWPPHTTRIYDDAVLLRTWARLHDRTELRLPEDVPTLVNDVYGEPGAVACPDGWARRWAHAAAKLHRVRDADEDRAKKLFLPPPTDEDAVLRLTEHPESRLQTRKPNPRSRRYG